MNASQILHALEGKVGNRCNFIGVYFSDELRVLKSKCKYETHPFVFIVNTLRLRDRRLMGHYLTIYVDNKKKLLCFIDSYALHREFYNKEINEFCESDFKLYELPFRLQHFASLVCGLYAVFFTITLSRGGVNGLEQSILEYFKRGKYKYNDAIIIKHMYKRLGEQLPSYSSVFRQR